jgi:hypothetical protein
MNEKALVKPSFTEQPIVYNIAEEGMAALEKMWETVPDCSDNESYKTVKEGIRDIVSLRTSLEARRKELKRESLDYGKRVDSVASGFKGRLEAVESKLKEAKAVVDKKKEAEKEAKRLKEQARVDAIQGQIDDIRRMAIVQPGFSSETIQTGIKALEGMDICESLFMEFVDPAAAARRQSVSTLKQHLEHKLAEENAAEERRIEQERIAKEQAEEAERVRIEQEKVAAERAELEKLRAEQAERERVAKEKADREQAERDAKAREEQLIREKELAEERAAQEEKLRKEQEAAEEKRRKAEAEDAERRRVEQAKIDAERRELAEKQRIVREEEERQQAEREAQEAEKARIEKERLSLELQSERRSEMTAAISKCYPTDDMQMDDDDLFVRAIADEIIAGNIPHVKYTG